MKWWHALALLAVGFGVGRADVSLMGTAKWEVGSETETELRHLLLRVRQLDLDESRLALPTAGADEAVRAVGAIRMRQQALELEAVCQATFLRHPDTLSHQYAWLASRGLTDRAANLVLWHQLAGLPAATAPRDHPLGTVAEYLDQAKLRMVRRGRALSRPGEPGGTEVDQMLDAFYDFFDCQW